MTLDTHDGMHTPTHDEAREQLPALALGALDAAEREALAAHVASCARCAPELAALRETAATLAFAAPVGDDAARRAAVRARLMARVAAERAALVAPTAASVPPADVPVTPMRAREPVHGAERARRTPPARGSARPWMVALAASLLVAAATGLWGSRAALERNALRAGLASARADAARVAELQAQLADRDRTLRSLTGREVSVMELTAAGSRAPWARMFFDRANRRLTMFAGNLPRPAAGRTYELWVIADGRKVPAGTFMPNERGDAVVRADYPASAAAGLQAVAVTAEPEGGVPQPTGPVVVASALPAAR